MCRATLACRDQGEGWAKPAEPGLPVSAYLSLQLAWLPMRKAQAMKKELSDSSKWIFSYFPPACVHGKTNTSSHEELYHIARKQIRVLMEKGGG